MTFYEKGQTIVTYLTIIKKLRSIPRAPTYVNTYNLKIELEAVNNQIQRAWHFQIENVKNLTFITVYWRLLWFFIAIY